MADSDLLLKPNPDLLPTSVAKVQKNVKWFHGANWVPIFCANCGKSGGYVPEDTKNHAFYLCGDAVGEGCYAKFGAVAGTYAVPDEVFFERVKQESIEKYGHELTATEQLQALADPESTLSKLARERYNLPEYNKVS